MKLGMAVTLAHDAKLLLLDEPTSGLDPVGRDEMLEIFRDYMVQEGRTIFFSTHITSDLEKIADYITYIKNGKILYSGLQDDKGDLNKLYLTLPVTRSSVVPGRYALSIGMGLIGLVTGIPLALLADRFSMSHYYGPIAWFLPVITISYLLFSVFNLCMFPVLFRLGYSKGKFWGMLVPIALFSMLYGVWVILSSLPGNGTLLFDGLEYARQHMLLVNGGMTLVATLILLGSFLLSKRLYAKREF